MSKHEPRRPLAFGSASEKPPRERRGGSESAGPPPVLGEIGFVGLGHMGTAMAANLAAAGRRVIAYVRRRDQIGRLEALGLRPTTDIVTCSTARSSSACCRTTMPCAKSCLVAEILTSTV